MRRRARPAPADQDPSVEEIERILSARQGESWNPVEDPPPHAANALWLCACVTESDAPIWLIHDGPGRGVSWCRLPTGASGEELVLAQSFHGDHVEPYQVLRWLGGEAPYPYMTGDEREDPGVADAIISRIR